MKIIHIKTIFKLVLLLFVCSCGDEDKIVISEKPETRFDIPQGDHDFDDQIVKWSQDYDINVLYRFSPADLNYKFTANKELNYEIAQWADEDGIRAAIQFLKEDFIDLYPDSIKKTLFPSKILLAGMLYESGIYEPLQDIFIQGMDHIAFSRVDNEFATRIAVPKYREEMKLALNQTFINFLLFPPDENLEVLPSTEIMNKFGSFSLVHSSHPELSDPYSYNNNWKILEDTYKLGFLEGSFNSYTKQYTPPSINDDLSHFIKFIFTQTKSELIANPLYAQYPQVKKKCDYLLNIFAEYGIDLHCVKSE